MAETKNENPSSFGALHDQLMLFSFLYWFFILAPKKIVEIWGNYLVAASHFFSISLLLRTLFSHWHKDIEGYGRGFDFSRWSRVFILNLISRGIGFLIRSVTIIIGLAVEVFILVCGFLFLAFWLLAPLTMTAAFVYGIKLLI